MMQPSPEAIEVVTQIVRHAGATEPLIARLDLLEQAMREPWREKIHSLTRDTAVESEQGRSERTEVSCRKAQLDRFTLK